MCKIAQTRHDNIISKTLKCYNNLKEIKDKIDGKSGSNPKSMKIQLKKETFDLGNKLRDIVEKESVYRPPPDEKTLNK